MIYERIKNEYERICKEIKQLEVTLASMPDGKLICGRSGKYYKWYKSDGHKKIYIPKKNRHLAEQLATKKYLICTLADLSRQKKSIESYFKLHSKNAGKSDNLLLKNSEYQKLLKPYFEDFSPQVADWVHAPYERNTAYPEHLIHPAASGNLVRSKSETLIDLYLYKSKIPFRYECALQLGETTLFPDFTILHPKTHKVFYWEHCGAMDNPKYAQNFCNKLQTYISNGIIPSIQLITTYETKEHPLSIEMIEKIIDHYFL